ncbi:hypothetical protein EIN_086030 [Entamoeba invadens IP1]|uniref:hypothetical protein n=1 Tax=Entamoeba invadens IP1 TaxID=370355 RepID=UPI0002C3E99B|nr:hypothetical protein EIN_086030 [Entamoeba invadens IP1]ELP85351.1 hypothetical protein EIN_086030 [Entamoeba invadens IP1]|eukprot:XP_004184697.1 hypothetical protein EIN_086030 [Entamoeba invadens IP1]
MDNDKSKSPPRYKTRVSNRNSKPYKPQAHTPPVKKKLLLNKPKSLAEMTENQPKSEPLRTIDVGSFVLARGVETKKFEEEIKRFTGNKTVPQSVPRHLRRRQASHNSYVLPHRLIKAAIAERARNEVLKGDKTAAQQMQKKQRRTRRSLRRNFKTFSWGKSEFLMTHVWHAKRSVMTKICGVRVALRRNEKCKRIVFARESRAMISDESFFISFVFTTSEECKAKLEAIFMKTETEKNVFQKYESRVWVGVSNEFGPLKLILGTSHILIIAHPIVKDDIELTLKNNGIQYEIKRLGLVKVVGKESVKLLNRSLELVKNKNLIDRLSLLPSENIPEKSVIVLTGKMKDTFNPLSLYSFPLQSKNTSRQDKTTFQQLKTHKELFSLETPEEVNDTIEKLITQSDITGFKEFKDFKPATLKDDFPLLLLGNKVNCTDGSKFGSGCYLVVPYPLMLPIWRRLVWHGGYSIEIEEQSYLTYEAGNLVFPDDFVWTKYGQESAKADSIKFEEIQKKRPNGKKFMTEKFKLDGESAMDLKWDGLTEIRRAMFLKEEQKIFDGFDPTQKICKFEISGIHGRPEKYCVIDLPSDEELKEFETEIVVKRKPQYHKGVGRVIRGGYSLGRGCGYGIGFVYMEELVKRVNENKKLILENGSVLVTFRNVFSENLRLGVLTLLP